MPDRNARLLLLAVTFAAACVSAPGGSHFDTTPDGSTDAGTTTASADGSSEGVADTTEGGPSTGPSGDDAKYDVAAGDVPLPTQGCQKIDFLFVIDASGSMAPHQQQLIDSYQGFVDGISAHFGPDTDFHIGVISSDAYAWNAPECVMRGALIDQAAPAGPPATVCGPYAEGHRFMTEQDDLAQAFNCTANVGTSGDFHERPVTATIEALSDAYNAPEACNDGFLRDDALLVIVMISDSMEGGGPEVDAHPSNDPAPWYPAILDAKGGHPENVVAIGFIAYGDTWCIPNGWDGYQAPPIISFFEDFGERGVLENVCIADYGPIFQESVDLVIASCDGFVPQG